MPDRRLLPLAVAFITACNPSAPILLPNIDAGSAVDGGTTDRSIADSATDAEVADAPLSADVPIIDIVLADMPDVPMAPDVPAVMDVVSMVDVPPPIDVPPTVDVPDVPSTVDAPDVPTVADAGTCPPGMVLIPGGTINMGDVDTAVAAAQPVHSVTVSTFCMDVTEVTVAAYSTCAATVCSTPNTGTLCNWGASGRGSHPINCVTWDQARAYCQSRGGTLPTDAQWEYAARGPDGRTYPWGNAIPTTQVCWSGSGSRLGTCPVQSFPAGNSAFGVFDLTGNVWEWVADWYAPYGSAPVIDPTGPSTGTLRTNRGGAWGESSPTRTRPAFRSTVASTFANTDIGFRCAHAPL